MADLGRTFHPFPRLPAELRLQVWEQSREYGREVDVRVESRAGPGGRSSVHLLSRTPTPAILHTCQESRYSRAYQQAFMDIPHPGRRGINERSYVWVNWDCDTINVGKTNVVWFRFGRDCASIQCLRFERNLLPLEIRDLQQYLSLKRVVFICKSGEYDWRPAFTDCPTSCTKKVTVVVGQDNVENLEGNEDTLVDRASDITHEEWSVVITPSFFSSTWKPSVFWPGDLVT
ncbi:hypothetical protein QBC45DRAFT_457873 [Copromyces sp. CBS 386.78]|nr:hypothetical protein QBC45DRAFT_457873 [Copromyces sp. CBS 386.78]